MAEPASAPKPTLLAEFKTFLLRGNVVDLAVAVVVGVAFGAVITALVKDILTPIIAAIVGKPDFAGLAFTVHKSRFLYGDFINAVVSFASIAAAVFFLVVKPVNYLIQRHRPEPGPVAEIRECPECLSKIPVGARRCAFCTAEVAPA